MANKEKKGKRPKSKSKHKKVQMWKKYSGQKKFCPRCGPGTFLAVHKNRTACGKCKYSEIQVSKK